MYYIEFTWKSKLLADLQSRSSGFRIISSQSYQQICKKPSLKWERLWQNIFICGPSKEENSNQNFYYIAFCYYPLVLTLPSRGLKKISILFMKNPKNSNPKNLAQKFGQSSIFPRNQVFSWKCENFDELQLPYSLIFLLKLRTRFLFTNVYKSVCVFFYIV